MALFVNSLPFHRTFNTGVLNLLNLSKLQMPVLGGERLSSI